MGRSATYTVSIHKTLEDGTVVEVCSLKDQPGWYVSPVLKEMARRVHEPAPPQVLEGQMRLTDAA